MTEFTKEQGGVGAYCPFCGDERNLVEIGVPFDDGICHVECARCGAHGPVESAEDRAISAWNLRAGGPAERPALNAKEFSREELETLAGLSAFESNPVVRLAQVAAFALAQMERAEKAEKALAEQNRQHLATLDLSLEAYRKQEARHRREVIKTRIDVLESVQKVTPVIQYEEHLGELRAELAALERPGSVA